MKQPWDPDPLHVPEQPVRPVVDRSGCVIGYVFAALVIVVLLIVAAASRRGPDSLPTPSEASRAPVDDAFYPPEPTTGVGSEGGTLPLTTPIPGAPTSRVGWATYYDDGPGFYGAVHSWRFGKDPYFVMVCLAKHPGTCTHVLVRDFCACGKRHGEPTVIDLSPAAFRELAPLSRGVIRVIVTGPISVPLPATDATP